MAAGEMQEKVSAAGHGAGSAASRDGFQQLFFRRDVLKGELRKDQHSLVEERVSQGSFPTFRKSPTTFEK